MSVYNDLNYFRAHVDQKPGLHIPYDAVEIQHTVAKAIYLARIMKGFTQQELAFRAGLSQTAITRLESGLNNPTIVTLNRIATALDKVITLSDAPLKPKGL